MTRNFASFALVGALSMSATVAAYAQQQPTLAAPTIFRMSGTLQTATGEPRTGVVVMVASVYSDQSDVTPLWSEAQTLTIDATGRYALLVGGTVEGGVPGELFRNGTGRWIGVGVQGEAEQPRVMMFAVPYAVKALDADMLGGKTAADFVLSNKTSVKNADGTISPMVPTTDPLDITACCTHVITGGQNAAQVFDVKNTTAGTTASTRIRLFSEGNDGLVFTSYSSGFTAAGLGRASSGLLNINVANGLSIAASHASGAVRFYTGGNTDFAAPNMAISPTSVLTVAGVGGSHSFSGSSDGVQSLDIKNNATSANASTRLRLYSDGGNDQIVFTSFSSGFTASGLAVPGSGLLNVNSAGGLALVASHSSGSLRFIAGGTTERMRIDSAGNVGIGTTSPGSKLDVTGSINVSGNINAKYQDVAEWVDAPLPLEAGTVVIIDPTAVNRVIESTKAYDTRIAGAVSAMPGLVLGDKGDNKEMIAQGGRVRVKVDAKYGAIKIGDLLVTSSTPGHAMKSKPVNVGGVLMHRPGTILGRALETWTNGKGEILVLLGSQ